MLASWNPALFPELDQGGDDGQEAKAVVPVPFTSVLDLLMDVDKLKLARPLKKGEGQAARQSRIFNAVRRRIQKKVESDRQPVVRACADRLAGRLQILR